MDLRRGLLHAKCLSGGHAKKPRWEQIQLPRSDPSIAALRFWTLYSLSRWFGEGLPKPLCRRIVHDYLRKYFFEEETSWLRGERFMMQAQFQLRELYRRVQECLRWETRLLLFESGALWIRHADLLACRPDTRSLAHQYCIHPTVWARVRNPPSSPPCSHTKARE